MRDAKAATESQLQSSIELFKSTLAGEQQRSAGEYYTVARKVPGCYSCHSTACFTRCPLCS